MRKNSYLELIAGHLNAPYGDIVSPEDVARALRDGDIDGLSDNPFVYELVSTMFWELEPAIIGWACYEAGTDIANGNELYKKLKSKFGYPAVYHWEEAMKGTVE